MHCSTYTELIRSLSLPVVATHIGKGMDQTAKLEQYRELVTQVLQRHAAMEAEPHNYESTVLCDTQNNDYRLIDTEILPDKRLDHVVIQLLLRDGKVWIERDGIEYGISQDLLEAGIPANDIVVGLSQGHPLTLAEAA
jgi:hypothetical protein